MSRTRSCSPNFRISSISSALFSARRRDPSTRLCLGSREDQLARLNFSSLVWLSVITLFFCPFSFTCIIVSRARRAYAKLVKCSNSKSHRSDNAKSFHEFATLVLRSFVLVYPRVRALTPEIGNWIRKIIAIRKYSGELSHVPSTIPSNSDHVEANETTIGISSDIDGRNRCNRYSRLSSVGSSVQKLPSQTKFRGTVGSLPDKTAAVAPECQIVDRNLSACRT